MVISSEVNPANNNCYNNINSTITTPGTKSSNTSSKLNALSRQVNSNSVYDTLPETTDINNTAITSENGVMNIDYTGTGGYKKKSLYNVKINKTIYFINAMNNMDAAKNVYKNIKLKKYCLIEVNKGNKKSEFFKGFCYKNGRKFVKNIL